MGDKPFSRSVQRLGPGSYGVTIPKELLDEYGIELGDELPVDFDRDADEVKFPLTD